MNFKSISLFIVAFLITVTKVFCAIKSSTGIVDLDANNDGVYEMRITDSLISIAGNLTTEGNVSIIGKVGIGESNPSSNIHINGTVGFSYQTVSTDTTLGSNTHIFADTSVNNVILTLPYAGNVEGRMYRIKKMSLKNSLVLRSSDNAIEGSYENAKYIESSLSEIVPQMDVVSTEGNWWITSMTQSVYLYPNFDGWVSSNFGSNVLLWLDASDSGNLIASSGNLSTWSDKSGQSNDASQSADANKPKTGVATLGGLNVVSFASGNYMELPNISSHQSVAVLYYDSGSNQYTTFLGTAYSSGGSYHGHIDTTQTFTASYTRTETRSGDNFRDGVDIGDGTGTARPTTWAIQTHSATQPFSATYQITKLGADNSSSTSRSIVGAIAEVIVFDMPLSTSNREKIEGYLAWKWGLLDNLSSSHPYRRSAP